MFAKQKGLLLRLGLAAALACGLCPLQALAAGAGQIEETPPPLTF